jgi:hypothetical protein
MIVSFSPDCPFCKLAADRERALERDGSYRRVTWVTDKDAPSLAMFVHQLSPRSHYVVSAELFQALSVRAVPGLYLVDPQDHLRWVGPYRGDEPESLLMKRCEDAAASPATTSE